MYQISITPQELEALPRAAFTGKIEVIDKVDDAFFAACRYLSRQKILGFDTESRPTFSPDQPHYGTSLLQLSGPEKAFLFRVKYTGMHKKLCAVLANPDILKIGAAVADDVKGLQKLGGFKPAGFVDLQKIGWEYGIKERGVKKMSAIILGVRISKTQQLSNWEAERLSEAQRVYAATDAWVCREMYLKLLESEKHPLTEQELDPQHYEAMQRKAERAAELKKEIEERRAAKAAAKAARMARQSPPGEGKSRAAKRRRRRREALEREKQAQQHEQNLPQEGA